MIASAPRARAERLHAGGALLLLAAAPVIFLVTAHLLVGDTGAHGWIGFDFRTGIVKGAHQLLEGHSPYEVARIRAHEHDAPADFSTPAYPIPGLALGVPFLLLPAILANALVVLLLLPVPALALRLLDVVDWRVHVLVYSCLPMLSALELGTVSPLLLLAAAAAWRFGSGNRGGLALGAGIVLKLILWPLVPVLLAMRRRREAVVAVAVGAVTLAGWLALSPSTVRAYLDVVRGLSSMQQGRGLSLVSFGVELGLSAAAARLLMLAAGACLLVIAVGIARTQGSAAEGYAVGICAALALTPIVWNHYFLLAVIPLALLYPRYSWHWWAAWAVGWILPATPQAAAITTLALPIFCGAVAVVALRRRSRPLLRAAVRPTA